MGTLNLESITKRYGVLNAVSGISFSVSQGESVGYLGPNGAGKSTTIEMLAGLIPPTEGRILYGGHDIWKDSYWYKERFGYVPEESRLFCPSRPREGRFLSIHLGLS